jgi:DNA-binding SARP family transcriptional activator
VSLRLRLLGRPVVSRGERALKFRSRKELALLLYLATEGSPQRREKLAALFWPESRDESSRAALRNALYGLRKTLRESTGADHLRVGRDSTIGLDFASGVELDLGLLEAAPTRPPAGLPVEAPGGEPGDEFWGVLEELRTAAEAYRGEFLEGFSLDDAPDFDYWVGLEREGWRRRIGAVLDRLSGLELAAGEVSGAIATAGRWTRHAPASEAAHLRLMEAYFAAGDGTEALYAFEECRRVLGEELGVGPSPETEALAARIRAEAPPRSPRIRSREPGEVGPPRGMIEAPFVGRSEEFGVLVAEYYAAYEGGARAVAVAGEAGIGKTRLVEEFLRWAAAKGANILRGRPSRPQKGYPTDPWSGP